ncbi:MAG: double-strand break repair protein AddB [Acetobacteraceae bacterium]
MNLYELPATAPFLDSIAAAWLDRAGDGRSKFDPARTALGLILLPTRRAARALAEAFLRQSGGRPLLLPRIAAFGALDEAPLALGRGLELLPAVGALERLAVLARLILAAESGGGLPGRVDRAWALAAELALLQDEAERAGVDLRAALPDAVPEEYAAHWQQTLGFLRIVTEAWPAWLAEQGLMNPAARQVAVLAALGRAWQEAPPDHPIWAAGSSGEIPAVARLIAVIARLPEGRVILPGFDRAMAEEHFSALGQDHPEHADAGLARLLAALGARRDDVRPFSALAGAIPPGRPAMLRRALLPAPALSDWALGDGQETSGSAMLAGLSRLDAADQQEEAVAIALALRGALEVPGARAALVTPDRELARRVTAELGRFGVVADDSAGENLDETPPAVFVRLLAAAALADFAPVALLALLKHPLFAAGLKPQDAREAARTLEIRLLRGPGPPPGLAALEHAAERTGCGADLVRRLVRGACPLERARSAPEASAQKLLIALVESAEALAETDHEAGPARLWAFEEGEGLAAHLAELISAVAHLPPGPPAELPALLDAALKGVVVRSRRALRGAGDGVSEHPRVFIWGLLEARLQAAEFIVLGGLAEGTWPPATDPGPWLSRPMRAALGLASPEEAIGRAARDFLSAALSAPEVVFSAPRRRAGAPAVPARWLVRLQAMLGANIPPHPAVAWARALDRPLGPPKPARAPEPVPPLRLRPRKLAVTDIATWLADPYAIYARQILCLRPLPGIAEVADAADFGQIVHRALAAFVREAALFTEVGAAWPAEAEARLDALLRQELARAHLPPHLANWWWPRLKRIAGWVAAAEVQRREAAALLALAVEQPGQWTVAGSSGPFILAGRADRIEHRGNAGLAILDYKTGRIPTPREVASGRAPQLPLLAAMAEAGAFGPEFAVPVSDLTYWRVGGGAEPGEVGSLGTPEQVRELIEEAVAGFTGLVAAFDDPNRPYLAQPHPGNPPAWSEYSDLARLAEWVSGDE